MLIPSDAARRPLRTLADNAARRPLRTLTLIVCMSTLLPALSFSQSPRTKIVFLGTGTPLPDPDRNGPATAIVVDSIAYLFDAGTGIVRRAEAASRAGIPALKTMKLGRVFLTHLHSDHTLGLADLIFTPWIAGRVAPMEIFGPPGTKRLVNGILDGNF